MKLQLVLVMLLDSFIGGSNIISVHLHTVTLITVKYIIEYKDDHRSFYSSKSACTICRPRSSNFVLFCFFFSYLYRSLASVKVNKVRYVVWSSDMAYVSLLGKHGKSKLEIHFIDVALLKGHVVCRFCLRQHMIDSCTILCINNIRCLLVVFQHVEISRLNMFMLLCSCCHL